ncbi:MAG: DUF5979 domain-containing protein [Actinomycetaceae bacterium]|nr:DUF5979 domain-containing protein [Actinomycetaceae bacterium]
MVGLVAPANAANPIKISNMAIVKSDVNGNVSSSLPIRDDDVVKLTFDWDGRSSAIKSGDSFKVELPSVFNNLEYPQSRDLEIEHNGEHLNVGTCELTQSDITCTFNKKVEDLRSQGFSGFHGTGTALLKVKGTCSKASVPFTVNGQKVDVDIPGGRIDEKLAVTYKPYTFSKVAALISTKTKELSWEINFNSDYISQLLAEAGKPITVDGKTVSTLTFTDTLGPGQSMVTDPSRIRLMMRNSAAEPDLEQGVAVTDVAGKDYTDKYGDFDLKVETKGGTRVFTVTGPFAPETNYKVYYYTTPTTDSGTIQPGFKYTNQAQLDGTDKTAYFERYYSATFSIDIKMEAGFGAFNVTKLLAGNGSGKVADGTQFNVKVKYTLPGGATTDSYKGWEAPGKVSADKTGGEADFTVTAGQKTTFTAATFPKGTVIELSEDSNSASPAANGVTWGASEFKVGNQVTNTFTIEDQKATAVELTNDATLKTGTFSVAKSGSGADVSGKEFTFAYECTDGQSGSLKVAGNGQAVASGVNVPVGEKCTITEDKATAAVDGYDLKAPEAQTISIAEADAVVPVSFVNAYTAQTGDFSIAKSVAGNDAAASRSYTFAYECGPDGSGTLTVPGDGTAVKSPQIRAGAKCTIAEDANSAQASGYTLKSELSKDSVTIGKGSTVAVTAKNTYTRETGTFSVKKSVVSNGTDFSGASFDVDYVCSDGTKGSLSVPGNGKAVSGPSLPTGTSCQLSEKAASAQRDGYSVASSIDNPTVTIAKDAPAAVTVTNTYTRLVGGFTVGKTVAGDGAAVAPKEYAFDYACVDGSGAPTVSGSLTVPAGQSQSVADVPTGSCTVTEKDASVSGATLTSEISADGKAGKNGSVSFNVADGSAVAVAATNTYTLERAGFSVAKKVDGLKAADISGKTFTFDYVCKSVEGDVTGSIDVPGDGSAVKADELLPVGTSCTVSENSGSAVVENYDVTVPEAQTFTVGAKDSVQALQFVNTYSLQTGDFSVAKSVSGVAGQEGREFAFDYTCTNGVEGSLAVKADGNAVASGNALPIGTSCTIKERTDSAGIDGYDLKAPKEQKVTITAKDEVVASSFVNAYDPVVPTEPSPSGDASDPSGDPSTTPSASTPAPSGQASTPDPSGTAATSAPKAGKSGGSLARTGLNASVLGILALAGLGVGGVLVARRRKA